MRKTRFSGERLRQARGRKTLEELARAIGVTRWTVARWEAGRTEPPASRLAAIAEETGKPFEFFFIESPEAA